MELPPDSGVKVTLALNAQKDLFSITRSRSQKALQHVEVSYRKNPVRLNPSELDFFVATDRSIAGAQAIQDATSEWKQEEHPQATGTGLDTDKVFSPIYEEADALELAEKLWNVLIATSKDYFDFDGWMETQAVEPWYLEITLTDDDLPAILDGATKAYLVATSESPYGSRSTVVLL